MDFANSWALVVVIDAYGGGIPPLGNAARDAGAIADALEQQHDFALIRLLDHEATHDALQDAVVNQLPERVGEDDRVFVYFAGHGIAQDGDDGPEGFLVPVDARPEDRDSLFPMLRLHESLAALPCRHMLLVLDCCFAGSFRWAATRSFLPGVQTLYRKRYERFVGEPAWQVLTSTAPDQKALDLLDGLTIGARETSTEHSPFANALLDGLAGNADRPGPDGATDGVITATELYLHVRDVVELGAESQGKEQTPGLWPLPRHGRGEFLFHVPGREPELIPDPVLDAAANPWPGLAAYGTHQADLFFGRTRVVEQLRARLERDAPLVAVIGASGTGKSSVVKAGLAASLSSGDEPWAIVGPHRPGEAPLQVLDTITQELADTPITDRTLVLLDQFEEVYTLCRDADARNDFLVGIEHLLATLPERATVLLTARADFLPQLRAGPLAHRIEDARFTVPPMTTDELREVIEGPAQARVLYFEPQSLVDRLVDEVVAMPGALPLLSFTLSEMYFRYLESGREDRALREQDYDALGGVVGSLRSRASALYDAASNDAKRTIERVLVRMVAIDGGDLAKRRVARAELEFDDPAEDQRVSDVLEQFTDARLLLRSSVSGDASVSRSWAGDVGHTWVEPTHDMLVIAWDRVHLWLDRLGPEVHLQRALWNQASAWAEDDGSASLWHDDPRLPVLESLAEQGDSWLNRSERAFVRKSVKRRDANATRRRRLLIALGLVLIAGMVGIAVFAGIAVEQRDGAIRARQDAERERDHAVKLTMLAGAQTARDPTTSAVLLRDLGTPTGLPLWNYVVSDTVDEPVARQAFQGHTGAVVQALFAPGGSRVLTISEDGSARIWPLSGHLATSLELDPNRGRRVTLEEGGPALSDGDWSPSGDRVVTASRAGVVQVHDARSGQPVQVLQESGPPVLAVQWSPDGTHIAATGASGHVHLWDAATGGLVRSEEAPDDVWGVHLDWRPDGGAVAVAGYNGWAAIVPLEGAPVPLEPPRDGPRTDWLWVEFAPDGEQVALAGEEGQAGIWNTDGEQDANFVVAGRIRVIRWSPDGSKLITGSSDHRGHLWTRDGEHHKTLEGHRGGILHAAFVGDGRVLTSSIDNTVRAWGVDKGVHLVTFDGHAAGVRRIDLRPDGKRFVTASGDWTARLWSPDNASESVDFPSPGGSIGGLAWSPTCAWLSAGESSGLLRLWRAPGNDKPIGETLQGHIEEVVFSPDGRWLAAATLRGQVAIRACATPRNGDCAEWAPDMQTLQGEPHADAIEDLAWGGDPPLLVAAGEDERARVWRAGSSFEWTASLEGHTHPLTSVAVSPDGSRIATGASDRTVLVWDSDALDAPIERWTYPAAVAEVAFSPDGSRLAVRINAKEVYVHAVDAEPKVLGSHDARVRDLEWNRAGTQLLTASADHTARIWNAADGTVQSVLKGHTGPVIEARFGPQEATVLTGSYDNTVRVWRLQTTQARTPSEVVDVYEGAVTRVRPGCDPRRVLSGAADGSLRNTNLSSVHQMRGLLEVLTDYCIPPGEAHLLTGWAWEDAKAKYEQCLQAQATGETDAHPLVR